MPNASSESINVPEISPGDLHVQCRGRDGADGERVPQSGSTNHSMKASNVNWEHLPSIWVKNADGSHSCSHDISPTSQLSWDRLSDILNESSFEDDQHDVPDSVWADE